MFEREQWKLWQARAEKAEAKLAAAVLQHDERAREVVDRNSRIASLEAEVERLKAPCNACAFKAMRLPEEPARPARGYGLEEAMKKRRRKA